jgi:hypothetical protein
MFTREDFKFVRSWRGPFKKRFRLTASGRIKVLEYFETCSFGQQVPFLPKGKEGYIMVSPTDDPDGFIDAFEGQIGHLTPEAIVGIVNGDPKYIHRPAPVTRRLTRLAWIAFFGLAFAAAVISWTLF